MTNLSRSLILGCSVLALAACGPEDLGSPGANGDINIGDIDNSVNTTTPAPSPTSTTPSVTPAADCPTVGTSVLTNVGTISNAALGSWRVCELPSVFTEDSTIPALPGVIYSLNGRVDVGIDDGATADGSDGVTGNVATLNIEEGVILYGATGRSFLVVNRGSRLNANGTATRPIIFTSRNNVIGAVTNTSSQQWGGVVLLGRAPVSDCSSGTPNTTEPISAAAQIACNMELEGELNPPSFGGNSPTDNSGSLRYVQIRYSGFTIAEGNELQSLTTGGVGSATKISYIQSYNSSDDGVELFGGHPKLDHFIVVGAEDDSFDIDSGAKADIQYALAVQRPGAGDSVLELDSPDADYSFNALPRTNATFTNFTFIGAGSGSQVVRARGLADLNMSNGVMVKSGNCLRVDEEDGAAAGSRADEKGPPIFNSVGFACTVAAGSAVDGYITAGVGNTKSYTSTLTGGYINGANETGYTPIFNATTLSSFFTTPQPSYIGAVPTTANWATGWTCDSATVSFGSGNSCQTLPVYN